MKTDELIAVLSTNVEPVDSRAVGSTVRTAILAGIAAAVAVEVLTLGLRPDLHHPGAAAFLLTKSAFGLAVVALASVNLLRHIRPGGEFHARVGLTIVPFAAVAILAALHLGSVPPSHWHELVAGHQWLQCLVSIPIIAMVPFAVIMLGVRMAAPTDLRRTGALVGLLAGGMSAMAYALHCTDDSLAFIAVWYGGTVFLCTLAGAALGPRLLRW